MRKSLKFLSLVLVFVMFTSNSTFAREGTKNLPQSFMEEYNLTAVKEVPEGIKPLVFDTTEDFELYIALNPVGNKIKSESIEINLGLSEPTIDALSLGVISPMTVFPELSDEIITPVYQDLSVLCLFSKIGYKYRYDDYDNRFEFTSIRYHYKHKTISINSSVEYNTWTASITNGGTKISANCMGEVYQYVIIGGNTVTLYCGDFDKQYTITP